MEPETQLDSMTNEITLLGPGLLGILLKDRTTRGHILWATDDYCTLGPRYAAGSQILQKLITGANAGLVRPRAVKAQDQRSSRTRNRAEVFTPSWICNAQNNLVDARWFGRPDVFNTSQGHTWTPRRDKISFPPHLTWKQYVDARRLEISCGEAPYLVSRYDSVSGAPMDLLSRIGLLDRKLRIVSENADGTRTLQFSDPIDESFFSLCGHVPLPPYIERNQNSPDYDRDFDNARYETVYADSSKRVAAAAPTAGLHFTNELVRRLEERGNVFHNLTLHVGIGTFQPLKSDIVEQHKMHSEIYEIPADTLRAITGSKLGRLAVGTTSLRAMEDFCRKNSEKTLDISRGFADAASLFVYPPQKIISADAMITNFHLPRSTLMCLVAAFISPGEQDGIEILKHIYSIAVEKEYNFYSYGDAMLIL